jgi:hypothetical protein
MAADWAARSSRTGSLPPVAKKPPAEEAHAVETQEASNQDRGDGRAETGADCYDSGIHNSEYRYDDQAAAD